MSCNPATGKYELISWEDAFAMVGGTLRGLDSPRQASFYTSGRLSSEATYRAVPRARGNQSSVLDFESGREWGWGSCRRRHGHRIVRLGSAGAFRLA